MQKPVYLDYAATTPLDPRVRQAMLRCMDETWANPASRTHVYGWQAEEAVENARNQVAELLKADSREIVFTSGATESNNLAIKGLLEAKGFIEREQLQNAHVVTSMIEHKAVIDALAYLEKRGLQVTWLKPDQAGLISVGQVLDALQDNTVLVSLMWVNNEIGVLNPIEKLAEKLQEKNIILHVDAAQAVGKMPIDLSAVAVDLLSVSAHKFYGPKGVGALFVRRRPGLTVSAQIHGGGHERAMRSGTLATHQIVGLGEAAVLAQQELAEENAKVLALRTRLLKGIESLPNVSINGSLEHRVAGNLNISFGGLDGETLLMSLRDLALSTGSACTSVTVEPSYVLKALGLSDELAHSALRISLGRFSSEDEVDFAIKAIRQSVAGLRAAS